jgi:hypothetical protein
VSDHSCVLGAHDVRHGRRLRGGLDPAALACEHTFVSVDGPRLSLADALALVLLVLDDEQGRPERAAARLHGRAAPGVATALQAAPALASALARGRDPAALPPSSRALRRWLETHDLRPAARAFAVDRHARRAARWNR